MSSGGWKPLSPWVGTWRRTLTQEAFAPFFARQRDTTVFVSVEAIYEGGPAAAAAAAAAASAAAAAAAAEASPYAPAPATPAPPVAAPIGLRWSFGASPETLRHGYSLAVPSASGSGAAGAGAGSAPPAAPAPSGWRRLAVTACTGEGVVREDGGAISLQLFGSSFAAIVYRVLDEDTLAVSVTELPTPAEGERAASLAARDKAVANVQHGYMFRVA